MPHHPETYRIEINGISRDLRLFEVAPGVRIAILNILGDTPLVQAASRALLAKLSDTPYSVFVTAASKSIPLAHQMSADSGIPYVVLRKSYKSYMGDAIQAETVSITTNSKQSLYLDEKDLALIKGKQVVIVDDVISTGSTLNGMREIIHRAGGEVSAEAAIFTEGDGNKWQHIVSLGNLPVWINE